MTQDTTNEIPPTSDKEPMKTFSRITLGIAVIVLGLWWGYLCLTNFDAAMSIATNPIGSAVTRLFIVFSMASPMIGTLVIFFPWVTRDVSDQGSEWRSFARAVAVILPSLVVSAIWSFCLGAALFMSKL